MRRSRSLVLLLVAVLFLTSGVLAFAGKWKPYEFKGAASYKFRITRHEGGMSEQILYGFDVEPAEGEGLWKVTTTTTQTMNHAQLKGASVFGVSPLLSLAPTLMFGNPLFAGMIGEMDLEVGEKMSFYGAGKAHVVKKETVAGVEGFLCELYMKQVEDYVKVAELVVHPDLAYPLRSRSFDGGQVKFEMECLEYKKP